MHPTSCMIGSVALPSRGVKSRAAARPLGRHERRDTSMGTAEGEIVLDNGHVRLAVERATGRLTHLEHRALGISLVGERRLADNWRLLVPLPGWRGHDVFG